MKVEFVWTQQAFGPNAKELAEDLNVSSGTNQWKGWSYTGRCSSLARKGYTQETLHVEVPNLRFAGLNNLKNRVDEVVGSPTELWVNGRRLLNLAVWADDQIRKLRKRVSFLEAKR